MRMFLRRTPNLVIAALMLFHMIALAQRADIGRDVYRKSAKSVFVILASSGADALSEGTGFLVAGGKIVTNYHVVKGGSVRIDLGAIKVPAKIEKVDIVNDLAVLSVEADISSEPLHFVATSPAPGDTVYAIGNPEGLEKSISVGIVSGVREMDGRKLIQISSPISHGSSGGPILNSNGEVVAVAVGILDGGQNLNFAIPAAMVQQLLSSSGSTSYDVSQTIEKIEDFDKQLKNITYSAEPSSDWQKLFATVTKLWQQALDQPNDDPAMLQKIADKSGEDSLQVAIAATEKLIRIKPFAELHLMLAKYLSTQSYFAAPTEKTALLARAEKSARLALQKTKQPTAEFYFRLGDILEDEKNPLEAEANFKRALDLSRTSKDPDTEANCLRALTRTSYALGLTSESESRFEALKKTGKVAAYDYSAQGERLEKQNKYLDSAQAFETAASMGSYWIDWCRAGGDYTVANHTDDSLRTSRKCIELGTGQTNSESYLESAHINIASALSARGVYDEALSHAREAVALNSSDAFAQYELADALVGLHRYQEAITTAKLAVRLSDGRYSYMHFRLGSAYFETENWSFAKDSFEKAAELASTDDAAPYNVAICLVRMGLYRDAASWYEEVLRRNPNHKDRQDILNRIAALRR